MFPFSKLIVVLMTYAVVSGKKSEIKAHDLEAPDGSTFRKDYKFFSSVNGWMKLHIFPEQWNDARLACAFEGARLASPISDVMALQMTALLRDMDDKAAHTGVHSVATVNDYFSIEGIPLSEMPVKWEEDEPDNFHNNERCISMTSEGELKDEECEEVKPYICYKERVGKMTPNECGNFDKYYAKDNHTKSCYRFYKMPLPWHQAHTICSADGGHLAIINSDLEAQILAELSDRHNCSELTYLGFQNWRKDHEGRLWYTLDGKTLEEAGFSRWAKGEPDSILGREDCGAFEQKHGKNLGLHDFDCHESLPFICEIDPKKIPIH